MFTRGNPYFFNRASERVVPRDFFFWQALGCEDEKFSVWVDKMTFMRERHRRHRGSKHLIRQK